MTPPDKPTPAALVAMAHKALDAKVKQMAETRSTGSVVVEVHVADGTVNGRPKVTTSEAVK